MIIKVDIDVKEIEKFSANMLVVHMIKEALRNYDNEYFEHLYIVNNLAPNIFTFSVSGFDVFKTNQANTHFITEKGLKVFIQSADYKFISILHNSLLRKKKYQYKSTSFNLKSIKLLREEKFEPRETVIIKTISPILITDKDRKSVNFKAEDKFKKCFNYMCNNLTQNFLNRNLYKEIEIIPIEAKTTLRSLIIHENKYTFECNHGTFKLSGEKNDIEFLLEIGMGSRRSQGFGMVKRIF